MRSHPLHKCMISLIQRSSTHICICLRTATQEQSRGSSPYFLCPDYSRKSILYPILQTHLSSIIPKSETGGADGSSVFMEAPSTAGCAITFFLEASLK